MHVGADGRVASVDVVTSPNDVLSEAVVTAMKQWIFTPFVKNSVADTWVAEQPYQFGR